MFLFGVFQDSDRIALTDFDCRNQRDTFNKVTSSELSYYETESDVNDSDDLKNPTSVGSTEEQQSISDGLVFEGKSELTLEMNTRTRVPRTRLGLATTS